MELYNSGNNSFCHSFIFCNHLTLVRVEMDPEYIWGTLSTILQYSLDKTNMDNLEKPEYVEKEFQGEHAKLKID